MLMSFFQLQSNALHFRDQKLKKKMHVYSLFISHATIVVGR